MLLERYDCLGGDLAVLSLIVRCDDLQRYLGLFPVDVDATVIADRCIDL